MEPQTLRPAGPARRPRPFPPAATGLLPAPSALVSPRHCRDSFSADSTLISSQSVSRPRLARCGYRHRLGELYRRRPPMPLLLLPAHPTPPVLQRVHQPAQSVQRDVRCLLRLVLIRRKCSVAVGHELPGACAYPGCPLRCRLSSSSFARHCVRSAQGDS